MTLLVVGSAGSLRIAAAQERIGLCVPEDTPLALVSEARLELRAHGLELVACAADANAHLVVEAVDPLGRPMAALRHGAETVRATRLREPLDVIDARLFALALVSLLDEDPTLPQVAPPPPPETETPSTLDDPEARASDPPDGEPETRPIRRVATDRALRPSMDVGLDAILLLDAEGAVLGGAGVSFGAALRDWFRFDISIRGAGADQGRFAFYGQFTLGFVLDLIPDSTALELSVGAVVGAWPPRGAGVEFGLVGGVGLVQRLSDWLALVASVSVTPYWNDGGGTVDVAGVVSVGPRFTVPL